MPVIQITYDVPLEIAQGLASGELKLLGTAAVRNSTNIAAHIREISRTVSDGKDPGRSAIAKSLANPKFVVVGLGVVAVVAAGGVVGWVTRRKQTATPKVPECVANYNASLAAYLEAISKGDLNAGLLSRLISDLDVVKEQSDSGKITLEFSADDTAALVKLVADYTSKLAEANAVHVAVADEAASNDADGTVIDLRRYFEAQRQIFEQSA